MKNYKLKNCGKKEGNKKVKLYNCDNMKLMKEYPDNYFTLGILDPPYGISTTNVQMGGRKLNKQAKAEGVDWDKEAPSDEWFAEIKRICENYIIWGANYYPQVWPSRGVIIWDKGMRKMSFADAEVASCTLDGARIYDRSATDKERIHVNQKPVELYAWIINKYGAGVELGETPTKKQKKILSKMSVLDTNLGSGSSAIAAHFSGVGEFIGCELNEKYFKKLVERFSKSTAQTTLFEGFGIGK